MTPNTVDYRIPPPFRQSRDRRFGYGGGAGGRLYIEQDCHYREIHFPVCNHTVCNHTSAGMSFRSKFSASGWCNFLHGAHFLCVSLKIKFIHTRQDWILYMQWKIIFSFKLFSGNLTLFSFLKAESLRACPHYACWRRAIWRGPKVTVCPEAAPQVTGVRHIVCLELQPVGVETLEE